VFPTTSNKLVTITLIKPEMERFVEPGRDRNEKNVAIALISAETEFAAPLVALTLDFSEMARRDV
jgi:hypothetical protein